MIKPGDMFSRLTVSGPDVGRHKYWVCRCSCGNTAVVRRDHLMDGRTRSCGCLARELLSIRARTHGKSASPIFGIWRTILARCRNQNAVGFKTYGARGIDVCERWTTFENFLADVGEPPTKQHSIDRWPDKGGNYEPGNVRWATDTEQARNTRSNRLVTHCGKTLCLAEWAELSGIGRNTIAWRLDRGWTPEKAMSAPPQHQVRARS